MKEFHLFGWSDDFSPRFEAYCGSWETLQEAIETHGKLPRSEWNCTIAQTQPDGSLKAIMEYVENPVTYTMTWQRIED